MANVGGMAQLLPSDVPALPLTGGNIDRGGQDRRRQEWLEAALATPATRVLAVREGALGRLTVEKADGGAILGSGHPLVEALSAAGFHTTPKGLRLRR